MSKELIEKLEAKAAELLEVAGELKKATAGKAVKKWKPEGGDYFASIADPHAIAYHISQATPKASEGLRDAGLCRASREDARTVADKIRAYSRLLAYVDEHAPGWEPEWPGTIGSPNFYVYYNHEQGGWECRGNQTHQDASKVYMPEKVARELVNKLNWGEVEL